VTPGCPTLFTPLVAIADWVVPVRVDNLDRKKSRSKSRLIKPRRYGRQRPLPGAKRFGEQVSWRALNGGNSLMFWHPLNGKKQTQRLTPPVRRQRPLVAHLQPKGTLAAVRSRRKQLLARTYFFHLKLTLTAPTARPAVQHQSWVGIATSSESSSIRV